MIAPILGSITASLPDIVFRKDLAVQTQGILNPKTMANLDSQGRGIANAVLIGRRVAYPRADVIKFLHTWVHPKPQRQFPSLTQQ